VDHHYQQRRHDADQIGPGNEFLLPFLTFHSCIVTWKYKN
jgi:hypothetical protein